MNNIRTLLGALLLAVASLTGVQAQTSITFESEDYQKLGVYDSWEKSPYRTGELKGNVAVVANHVKDNINGSDKILGIQRSHLGSCGYGARIDLKESFELTTTTKYIHVMMYMDQEYRPMIIGLGKRRDRAGQSKEVEQFWAHPSSLVKVGEWYDVVFPIKGNGGIDIYSLVIVPGLDVPTTDYVVYVDQIKINDDFKSSTYNAPYPINISESLTMTRTDRLLSAVGLKVNSTLVKTISIPSTNKYLYVKYMDLADQFQVKAGQAITPVFTFTGYWMHPYFYLDRGQDGQFSYGVLSTGKFDSSKDLLAYSYYRMSDSWSYGYSSTGSILYSGDQTVCPSTTIPSDLKPGFYRVRYKMDWNNLDPGGDLASIQSNGGRIVDVIYNVHEDNVNVTHAASLNGTTTSDATATFGSSFAITIKPETGFKCTKLVIRHGYNLNGDSLVYETPQYRDIVVTENQLTGNTYTITGTNVDGDILVTPTFGSATGVEEIVADEPTGPIEYFTLQGAKIDEKSLTPGIYLRRQGSKVTKVVIR
jgi:hypothetical protein